MAKMTDLVCHCGKKFSARTADVARGWARCCSKACAAIARERKLDRFGFQRGATGTFHSRVAELRRPDEGSEFSDAHLFSNEEHDCNKE